MNSEKLYIGGVNQDDERCLRCGSSSLDTGWECNECGYDNQPHYCSTENSTTSKQAEQIATDILADAQATDMNQPSEDSLATVVSITFTLPNPNRAEAVHDAIMSVLEATPDVRLGGSSISTLQDKIP